MARKAINLERAKVLYVHLGSWEAVAKEMSKEENRWPPYYGSSLRDKVRKERRANEQKASVE